VNTLNIAINNWQYSQIKIINLLGQTVFWQKTEGDNTQLNVSGLQPGIYILEVSGLSGRILQKFLKEKF
jgi:hypothetical protein